MRIIFFGSPPEAIDALRSLINANHDIVAVYSQPDRRAGRGRTKLPTPVKQFAVDNGLPVFTPAGLRNNPEELERLSEFGADVFVVVAYGRILPPEVLEIPRNGVVNIHPSLLPRYRGPSPVVTAILDGCSETGVTVMLLDEGMDTGPVLAQSAPVTLSGTERSDELQASLFKEGALLLPSVLDGLENGLIEPEPQDASLATVTGLLERSDGEIDWASSADQIERMIRAYDPWPGTFTTWNGKGLKILDARLSEQSSPAEGKVAVVDQRLFVGTGEGTLEITNLQLEGRQAATAAEFLRGHPAIADSTLG